jgi:hypothetical protein
MIPVPIGMMIEIEVSYMNHTFKRIPYADRSISGFDKGSVMPGENSDNREYFTVLRPTDRLDFEDVSTVHVTVELSGGLCNSTLGNAAVWFTRQPECGVEFRLIRNLTGFSTTLQLPAARFDYDFGQLQTNLPTFNLAVRDYLIRADNSSGVF